nr:hypothetical protein CPBEC1_29180 [Clostridium perfringens]
MYLANISISYLIGVVNKEDIKMNKLGKSLGVAIRWLSYYLAIATILLPIYLVAEWRY